LKLGDLAAQISKFGYIGGGLIAVAFMFQRIFIHNNFDMALISAYCSDWMNVVNSLVEAGMLAVIIIVMAVPEGLPLMIAIVSAQNMGKMLRDNVLVRKTSGIETAGSLNLLFSDKTGTITKGQLEAVSFLDGTAASFKSYSDIPQKLGELISLSVRYNTAAVINGDKAVGGNATERALLGFVLGKDSGELDIKVGDTVPFNSKNKYSLAEVTGAYNLTLAKGAPERLLDRCSYYYDGNGKKQPLSGVDHINAEIDKLAERAIRVLALAAYEGKAENGELPEKGLIFVGAVGIVTKFAQNPPPHLSKFEKPVFKSL
jgi:magnesium-transporting ATPase (P-type)